LLRSGIYYGLLGIPVLYGRGNANMGPGNGIENRWFKGDYKKTLGNGYLILL